MKFEKTICCTALDWIYSRPMGKHCLPPLFHCLPLWTTVRLHGKKLQNATNNITRLFIVILKAFDKILVWWSSKYCWAALLFLAVVEFG